MATITLTGTFEDAGGSPLNGRLVFTPVTSGPTIAGIIIAEPVTAAVVNGAMSITLLTTDSYNYVTGQVSYRVYEKVGGNRRTYYIVLPSTLGATVDLSTLSLFVIPPDVVIDPDQGTSSNPEVAQLQATVEAQATTIASLQSQIDSLSGSIGGFSSQISAINTELGSNPSGSESTIAARLDAMTATQSVDSQSASSLIGDLDARIDTLDGKVGNARVFAATSYPPAGYTAQNTDVWIDTTGL